MENCIIADIGGTNCRFFLYQVDLNDASKKVEIFEKIYDTKAFKNIYQVMDVFLNYKVCLDNPPKFGVIAIAGSPINNQIPLIANIAWEPVNGDDIATKYKLQYCKLLNDFEAVAYAFFSFKLNSLPLTKPAITNDIEKMEKDTIFIMGYGTGLGTVTVRNFDSKDKYSIVPQEGGHIGLGPTNEKDWEIMKFMREKFKIPETNILSQELLCCGPGISALYDFLQLKLNQKIIDKPLKSAQVFEELIKPENKALKETFLNFYMRLIGRSWEQNARAFLLNGGHFLTGGIVYRVLHRFFNGNLNSFLDKIKEGLSSPEEFDAAFKHVHIHFYDFDTQIFAVQGALNYTYLQNQKVKPNRFKTRLGEKDNGVKSIIKKPSSTNNEEALEKDQPSKLDEIKKDNDKKVNFDRVVSEDFEDFYFSNILKINVMTMTGFFNTRSIRSKLFIAKVISEPTFQLFKVEKARQRFQCYKIRCLDTVLSLLIPTNVTRLLINDIVLINEKEKLFYTKEDGWYFQSFDNVICDISVVIFNNLIEKFIENKPLLEVDKIHSKIKFEFGPQAPFHPRPEFDPERLLLVKVNLLIKSFNILMKVLEVGKPTYFRRSNDKVEEFTPVKIQSQLYVYTVHFSKWSEIPSEPFYGFFVKEDVILPGYLRNSILVVDDNSIVNVSAEFHKYFPEGALTELKINQMKVAVGESKPGKK